MKIDLEYEFEQETNKCMWDVDGTYSGSYIEWLENKTKQLLIYSVVCSLPTEEERDLEKDRVRDIILKEIPDLDGVSFGAGFRACFGWFTKRYTK